MQPTILAIRSIASEFFYRLYIPVLITFAIIFAVLFILTIWLITISGWWWILFAVIFLWFVIVAILFTISGLIIKQLTPLRTKEQKQQTKAMVDKMQRAAEVTSTPKFIILFRIVKDSLRPSERGYLSSLADETLSLRKDFSELKQSFASTERPL